jgi:hypothetical protein
MIAGGAAIGVLAGSVSCGNVRKDGAPVIVVVDSVQAASGASPGELSGFLLSDVLTASAVINDAAEATMRIIAKDVGNGLNALAPTPWNAVTLNRYRITFIRADGRNTPGVDVPFPVDGAITVTVTASPTTVPFEIVRHQQKVEQPLISLAGFGGRVVIATMAEITFYGTDQVGNNVQAKASINVSFSDYADPD